VETELVRLLGDRARIADMAARSGALGARDAADRMVDLVLAARGAGVQGAADGGAGPADVGSDS
jgi:hypothetical protein